ncbi:hypothetical protein BKA62DRAFT_792765 [Auriculariales sp. MPI-PUGE-AT-0066]|nr:hypothetical protein BKA62DRAFT_792765 [Auriculariales sp. MPI-PUGE-AT-0066]
MGMQSSPVSAPPRNGPPSIPPSPSHSSHSPSPRSSLVHIPTSRSQPQLHQQMPMTREHRTSASPSPRNSLRPMPHPPQHVNPNQRPPFDPGRPQTAPHSQGPPFGHPPPQAHWPVSNLCSLQVHIRRCKPSAAFAKLRDTRWTVRAFFQSPLANAPTPTAVSKLPDVWSTARATFSSAATHVSVPHPMLRGQRSAPSHLTAYVPVPVRESAYESTQAVFNRSKTASEHNQESEVVESAEQGQRAGRSTPLLHEMFSATTRPKTAPSNNGYLPSPPQSPTQSLYGTPSQKPSRLSSTGARLLRHRARSITRASVRPAIYESGYQSRCAANAAQLILEFHAYVPRENMPPTAHPSPSPSPVQSLTETRVRSLAPGKDLSPDEPLTPVGANTNMEQRRPQLGEPMFCFALEGRLQLAVEGEEDAIEVRWAELRRIDDDAFLGNSFVILSVVLGCMDNLLGGRQRQAPVGSLLFRHQYLNPGGAALEIFTLRKNAVWWLET